MTMNYFRLVPLFLRSTSTCLAIATVIDIAIMVPEYRPLLPRNSMIPHPPTIAPSWQDPICRLPYHLISVSGHDTPNTTLCQKAKKDYHKDCDICTLIWAGQLVRFFVIHATHVCHALATISKPPRLQTYTPAHTLRLNVSP